jgi:hypothetical protein
MPHSQHGKDTSAKQKPRRSSSHYSKGKHDKPKQLAEDVKIQPMTAVVSPNVQPAAEVPRPWSPWLPGDDGRWFYQGRLKADGSKFCLSNLSFSGNVELTAGKGGWEYQFTEGYPPACRRRHPNLYATLYQATTQTMHYNPSITVSTVVGAHGAPAAQSPNSEPVDGQDATEQSDDDDGQEDDTETYSQALPQVLNIMVPQQSQAVILANPTRPPAASKSGSGRQAVVKHASGKSGKKLSAIVKADKERRINSRKRVKNWLSGVTP